MSRSPRSGVFCPRLGKFASAARKLNVIRIPRPRVQRLDLIHSVDIAPARGSVSTRFCAGGPRPAPPNAETVEVVFGVLVPTAARAAQVAHGGTALDTPPKGPSRESLFDGFWAPRFAAGLCAAISLRSISAAIPVACARFARCALRLPFGRFHPFRLTFSIPGASCNATFPGVKCNAPPLPLPHHVREGAISSSAGITEIFTSRKKSGTESNWQQKNGNRYFQTPESVPRAGFYRRKGLVSGPTTWTCPERILRDAGAL